MTKISQGFQQFYVIFPIVNKSFLVEELSNIENCLLSTFNSSSFRRWINLLINH